MFQSPRWKTLSAVKKKKLADALASGNIDKISAAAGAIIAGKRALDLPMAPAHAQFASLPGQR